MTERPELLRRDRPYEGRLLHLRVDTVRLPSGRETTREVVDHPGATVMLPVTAENEIWFVRQYRYAVDLELLELPAGTIDPGETPRETAERELREEAGLIPGSLEQIATLTAASGYSSELIHVFLARDCQPTLLEERDEGLTIHRLSLDAVRDLVRQTPFPFANAATAFALLWFFGHEPGTG
jgi:ADP-ribose pyrophosphatase